MSAKIGDRKTERKAVIELIKGPQGYALSLGETRIAGDHGGMNGRTVHRFRVDADELRALLDKHQKTTVYEWVSETTLVEVAQ